MLRLRKKYLANYITFYKDLKFIIHVRLDLKLIRLN